MADTPNVGDVMIDSAQNPSHHYKVIVVKPGASGNASDFELQVHEL